MNGLSYFVCMMDLEMLNDAKIKCNIHSAMLEITEYYRLLPENPNIYIVQITMVDYTKTEKEMCSFFVNMFRFISLHQSGSRFIFIKETQRFKVLLTTSFPEKNRLNFIVYNMLSIDERESLCYAQGDFKREDNKDLTLLRETIPGGGHPYEISFTNNTHLLFNSDQSVVICDNKNGEVVELNLLERPNIFVQKIAFFKP